jgi:glycosyltransferase involved in cell wall biosynthesis
MNFPLVSICIPTYNGEAFIAEAMDSAISQTYPNLEIIVSDDASVDATLEIIESYRLKTSIPIHIFNHEPSGIGANWNHCIKKAKGEYIKFLFQDDVLMVNCVKVMVDVLEKDDTIALAASKREFLVDESYLNKKTKVWIEKYNDLQKTINFPIYNGMQILDKQLFKHTNFFNSPWNKVGEPTTILFRKTLVEDIGYFREDLKQILDYEFYNRVLKHHSIGVLQDKLVKFRLHEQQATVLNRNNDQKDYQIYDRLIYDDYFWYLNKSMRIYFLKKYNPLVRFYFKLIKKIKRFI